MRPFLLALSAIAFFGALIPHTDAFCSPSQQHQHPSSTTTATTAAATTARIPTTTTIRTTTTCLHQQSAPLWDPDTTDDTLVDFPTASQRKVLTKEVKKRQAWKKLAQHRLEPESSYGEPSFDPQALKSIAQLLQQEELVEVRGLAHGNKKVTLDVAYVLAQDLEMSGHLNNMVRVVSYKGHSAILYSPAPVDHPNRVPLRTSVGHKSVWEMRPKAPRDHRGQIIAGWKNEDQDADENETEEE